MTIDLLVKNARIVNSDHTAHGHIAVKDGRISAVYDAATDEGSLPPATKAFDANGRLVIPGGVDAHCHVEQVTGSYKSIDTFEAASIGALWGGTTTIIDFGIPANAEESPLQAIENKMALAKVARCDVALHGAVVEWTDSVPRQLEEMASYGVRSVKMYTTNRGTTMADDDTILRVMKEMVRLDGLTYIHSEHDPIIVDCVEHHATRGETAVKHLRDTRPALAEVTSVNEVLAMAEYTGAPVYFVHQTVPQAVQLVQDARSRGMTAYSETCPHYFALDDSVYDSAVPERYSCCPPIRDRDNVRELCRQILSGQVDTIASDHSCYSLEQKATRKDDMRFMPHGLPGVETRMPATFTTLVKEQGMDLHRFVEVFSTAPARINGLNTKGVIAAGYDADLVIFDPDEVRTVDGAALHMGTDLSPFHGMELAGWPSAVIAGGRLVLNEGEFNDPGPTGRLLKRLGVREMKDSSPISS